MLKNKVRNLLLEYIMLNKGYIFMESIAEKDDTYYFYCYSQETDSYSIWNILRSGELKRVEDSLTDLDLRFKSYGIIYN